MAITKAQEAKRDETIAELLATGLPVVKQQRTHAYDLFTKYGRVVFYPTSQKWAHGGVSYSGGVKLLLVFLNNRGMRDAETGEVYGPA